MKTDQEAIQQLNEDELFSLFGRICNRIIEKRMKETIKTKGLVEWENSDPWFKIMCLDGETIKAIRNLKRSVKK